MSDLRKLLDEAAPGPWEAALEPKCHGVVASINGQARFVALIGNDTDTPEREPMRFANAHLIAMAPGLAAALIKAEGELAYYQDQFCEGFCLDVPPGFTSKEMEIECSGCRARATLTEIRKLTGAA